MPRGTTSGSQQRKASHAVRIYPKTFERIKALAHLLGIDYAEAMDVCVRRAARQYRTGQWEK